VKKLKALILLFELGGDGGIRGASLLGLISMIEKRMFYNLFLTVHVPTHNAFFYNYIHEI
jgi:hypothetical protein